MILVEDTHWPLVVVGVVPDGTPAVDSPSAGRCWQRPGPRAAVFVVPETGARAQQALLTLLAWLRRHLTHETPCDCAAWVIPDAVVRAEMHALLDAHGPERLSSRAAVFSTTGAAIKWACATRDERCRTCPRRHECGFD